MKFPSVQRNQGGILYSISCIHNGGRPFDVDPCYGRGMMYADYPLGRPVHRFDISPAGAYVIKADARSIPLQNASVRSVVIDPPFLIHSGSPCKMEQKYTAYQSKEILMQTLSAILEESYRILKDCGLLVMKCQDMIVGRRKFFASLFILNTGVLRGFNPIDHFIFLPASRIRSGAGIIQYASHSFHSDFLVFRKKKSRTDYRSS